MIGRLAGLALTWAIFAGAVDVRQNMLLPTADTQNLEPGSGTAGVAAGAPPAAQNPMHLLAANREKERLSEEEALALVDRNDPCDAHRSCAECSLDIRCGWCAANSQCQMGGPNGPKPPSVCVTWSKGFCETSKCSDYTHCTSCLADPYCGWCSAPTDDPSEANAGQCMEGGSGGPGDAEGECPDNWRHSPVRKGTSYAFASKLDLTHGAYLREICESADGKIPYAAAPPAKPLPKKKPPVILDVKPRDGPVFGGTHITITGLWFGYEKTDQAVTIGETPCAETIWKSQSVIVCVTDRAPEEKSAMNLPVVVHFDGMQSSLDGNSGPEAPSENSELATPETSSMPVDVARFSYLDIEVDEIHPQVGKTEGGTIVSIRGRNFGRHDFGPTVKFGDRECVAVQWESPELIKCATAPGWGTDHPLDLTIEGVNPVTVPQTFSYLPPVVDSVVPALSRTAGNTTVVITGSNFGTRDVVPVITIGGTPCISQTWITHSRIDCETPPGVGAEHVVRVTVDVRISEGEDVTLSYLSPVIASIQPDHGPTTGGYAILITGTDFGTGAYEPSLTFQPAQWQHDVLEYGAPQTRLHAKEEAALKALDSQNQSTVNSNHVQTKLKDRRDLSDISIEIQVSENEDGESGSTWSTMKEWRLDSSSPDFFNNEWLSLDAPTPLPSKSNEQGIMSFRWIQTGKRPNAAILWAIDDIRIENGGGPAQIHVEVDGTRSAMAPAGTDFEGKPAPNSVTVMYSSDGMQDSGNRLLSVSAPVISGNVGNRRPGWSGVAERHKYCTRNFAASRTETLEECRKTCDDAKECNMFSWGYIDKQYLLNPGKRATHPDCRVSVKSEGCFPETFSVSKGISPLKLPSRIPVFLSRAKGGKNPGLGGFLHRVASHDVYPASGGVLSTDDDSSDITFSGLDNPIEVRLASPILVQKVVVRSGVVSTEACNAKSVKVVFPDGTRTNVDLEQITSGEAENNGRRSPAGGMYGVAEVKPVSTAFGLPVTSSYTVQITKTFGKCAVDDGIVRLRAVEVRGQILSVPIPISQNWQDDRTVIATYSAKENMFAVALRQNPFNRAKKVRLTAGEAGSSVTIDKVLTNSEDAQLLSFPGVLTSTGFATQKIGLEVLSTWDKVSEGAGQTLDEDFRKAQFDRKIWYLPSLRGIDAISYGYDSSRPIAPFYFVGAALGKRPVRSLVPFPVTDTEITVGLIRGHACSDHFIALSPSKDYKFSLGAEAKALKFSYNCDAKYIYGHLEPGSSPEESSKKTVMTECKFKNELRDQREQWKITITSDKAIFSGGSPGCGDVSMQIKDFNEAVGGQFYLYFGAASDQPEKRSYFDSLKVRVNSKGLKEIAFLSS